MPRGYPDYFYFAIHQVGTGKQQLLTVPDPVPGAHAQFTVPADSYWLLKDLTVQLALDPGGAARRVHLQIFKGVLPVYDFPAPVKQNPGEFRTYFVAPYNYSIGELDSTWIFIPIPPDLTVIPGLSVVFMVDGQLPGDAFTALQYVVQEIILTT